MRQRKAAQDLRAILAVSFTRTGVTQFQTSATLAILQLECNRNHDFPRYKEQALRRVHVAILDPYTGLVSVTMTCFCYLVTCSRKRPRTSVKREL